MKADVTKITETILGIERSINERWNNGDCNGYLETYSEDMTYFDPATEAFWWATRRWKSISGSDTKTPTSCAANILIHR